MRKVSSHTHITKNKCQADTKDRETLREKLELVIDPLDPEQHQGLGFHSTVVERVTHMRVYAGSSPTGADHRKEFILALSFSPNDVK